MSVIDMPAGVPELRRVVAESRRDVQTFAAAADIQWRSASGPQATGDGTFEYTGQAVVYDEWTDLIRMPGWTLREKIAPGALTRVLAEGPKVHFNHSHDMARPMARATVIGEAGDVQRGGMKLTETARGLDVFARLNPANPNVQALAVEMEDGLVQEMSFKFRIGDEDYEEERTDDGGYVDSFTITEVSDLFDVCACAQGAYPTTSGSLRSTLAEMRHAGIDLAGVRRGHLSARGVAPEVTSSDSAGVERARELAKLHAMARVARHHYPRSKS